MKTPQLKNDLHGQRFGRLVVRSYLKKGIWVCSCDCGAQTKSGAYSLIAGLKKSCGCFKRETNGTQNKSHGLTGCRAYRIWAQMKARCQRSTSKSFKDYGARGISVCERWQLFENFLADMGHPEPSMSLDRINNDGNYEPNNCRWASKAQQARNKRGNRLLTVFGRTQCLSDWALEVGIEVSTIATRLRGGWPPEDAVSRAVGVAQLKKLIEHNGEKLGLTQWANRAGIPTTTLKTRLTRGWSMERALSNASR